MVVAVDLVMGFVGCNPNNNNNNSRLLCQGNQEILINICQKKRGRNENLH